MPQRTGSHYRCNPLNILHSTTDPTLLARLKEMLSSSARADIAVGYFFIGGFGAVADDLARLDKVRILVGRTDRQVLEEVALGLQQHQALRARLDADALVRRSQRSEIAQETVARVAEGVGSAPSGSRHRGFAVSASCGSLVALGKVEVRAYLRSPSPRQSVPLLVRQPRRAWRGSGRLVQPHPRRVHWQYGAQRARHR